jgi:hypothetical protein
LLVIPAQAGIHRSAETVVSTFHWVPAFAGTTNWLLVITDRILRSARKPPSMAKSSVAIGCADVRSGFLPPQSGEGRNPVTSSCSSPKSICSSMHRQSDQWQE